VITKRKRFAFGAAAASLVVSLSAYSWFAISRPFAAVTVNQLYQAKTIAAEQPTLPWPNTGQAALSINGSAIRLDHAEQKAVPTASTAKVMTALSILDKKPLKNGEQGPTITLTEDDVISYRNYIAKQGSVVAVSAGEKITQRQALQAILLPSANNMADTLATWAFGSLANYTAYANQKAEQLGMKDTYIADASGFSPATVSTATDLTLLGEAALKNETLAGIVNTATATIPVAGEIRNRNFVLGQNGNIGIKTGNTDEAGGVFMFAANVTPDKQAEPIRITGAIMGAPTVGIAVQSSQPFSQAVIDGFSTETIIRAGDVVARYTAPWGQIVDAIASKNVSVLRWKGQALTPTITVDTITSDADKTKAVGRISAKTSFSKSTTPITLNGSFTPPSIWWRLTHPDFN